MYRIVSKNRFLLKMKRTKQQNKMSKMNKTAWGILLKLIIAVATSVAGVIGITSCIGG